jgi:hypothetical protein
MCLRIPERTFYPPWGGFMKRSRYGSFALVLIEKARLVYEYPGKLVLGDIVRLKKVIKQARSATTRGI